MKPSCHNTPRPDPNGGVFVLTRRYDADGTYYLANEWVPFRMSVECRQGKYKIKECEGCCHVSNA